MQTLEMMLPRLAWGATDYSVTRPSNNNLRNSRGRRRHLATLRRFGLRKKIKTQNGHVKQASAPSSLTQRQNARLMISLGKGGGRS